MIRHTSEGVSVVIKYAGTLTLPTYIVAYLHCQSHIGRYHQSVVGAFAISPVPGTIRGNDCDSGSDPLNTGPLARAVNHSRCAICMM